MRFGLVGSSSILLASDSDDRQRELRPLFRLRIEAGDLVRGLFGHPNRLGPWIRDRVICAVFRGRRVVVRHRAVFLIDLPPSLLVSWKPTQNIALPIRSHATRNVYCRVSGTRRSARNRVKPAHFFRFPLGKPNLSIARIHPSHRRRGTAWSWSSAECRSRRTPWSGYSTPHAGAGGGPTIFPFGSTRMVLPVIWPLNSAGTG